MTDEIVIKAESLTKRFGNFTATDHVTFEVRKGEIFGFLGANGAGKTTAMRMLCGLSQPSEGKATVAGYDVATEYEQVKRHIGYMSQKFSLYDDLTVEENLVLFGGIYGFLHKVYLFAAKPFVFFRQKMLTKMNSKFVSNAKKIRAKSKNYKKHLKNIPEMLYNKSAKMK